MIKRQNPVYALFKSHKGSSVGEYDGPEEDRVQILNGTTNLVSCIDKIHEDIALDKNKYKQEWDKHRDDAVGWQCESKFTVTYDIMIFMYEGCGWNYCFDIYTCEWNFGQEDDTMSPAAFIKEIEKSVEIHDFFKIHEFFKLKVGQKINMHKSFDFKKFKQKGDVDQCTVNKLLADQQTKCYKCGDELITHSYVPRCLYQFSIDRLDNSKPHNKDNIAISCYFCNCKDHPEFLVKEKTHCSDKSCFCNSKFYFNSNEEV